MPKFEGRPKPDKDIGKGGGRLVPIPGISEPRCHVCQSDFRAAIDKLIAQGATPYVRLAEMFSIDRRSISRHAKQHLSYEEEAIRRIIEDQAEQSNANLEEGIKGIITRRVYLNVALHKALDSLLAGDVTVEPKDALAVIQHLDRLDSTVSEATLDEMQAQFAAFTQAIQEICPPDMWQMILDRTRALIDGPQELLGDGS